MLSLHQILHEQDTNFGDRPKVSSIITSQWRLSVYIGKCKNELFDLENDPGEFENLWDVAQYAGIKTELLERLAEMEITAADHVPVPLTEA